MIKQTFRENREFIAQAAALEKAILYLSAEGFVVKNFRSGESPSVQIDRPIPGTPHAVTERSGKRFGHCTWRGVRVYWEIPQRAAQAA